MVTFGLNALAVIFGSILVGFFGYLGWAHGQVAMAMWAQFLMKRRMRRMTEQAFVRKEQLLLSAVPSEDQEQEQGQGQDQAQDAKQDIIAGTEPGQTKIKFPTGN